MKGDLENYNKRKQRHLVKQLQSVEQGEGERIFSTDDWEVVDMKKQLHPIGHYINDREEMVRQMFNVIHGDRLKKMLPPILKDVDIDELKADCLIHLVGMSSKRIKAILEGCDLEISSDESDDSVKESKANIIKSNNIQGRFASDSLKKKIRISGNTNATSNKSITLEDNCSVISGDDMLEIGINSSDLSDMLDSHDESKLPKLKKRKLKQTKHQIKKIKSETVTNAPKEVDIDLKPKVTEKVSNPDEINVEGGERKGKTLLEILELEMRARAIRALIQRDDKPKTASPQQTGEEVVSVSLDKSNKNLDVEIIPTHCETIDLTSDEQVKPTTEVATKTNDNVDNCTHESKNIVEIEDSDDCKIDQPVTIDNSHRIIEGNEMISEKEPDKLPSSEKNEAATGNSWAQRWLEKKSKDVKRLVTTSKMCTNIRNKMKRSNKTNIKEKINEKSPLKIQSEFKGSIEEYNMLSSKIVPEKTETGEVPNNDTEDGNVVSQPIESSPQLTNKTETEEILNENKS